MESEILATVADLVGEVRQNIFLSKRSNRLSEQSGSNQLTSPRMTPGRESQTASSGFEENPVTPRLEAHEIPDIPDEAASQSGITPPPSMALVRLNNPPGPPPNFASRHSSVTSHPPDGAREGGTDRMVYSDSENDLDDIEEDPRRSPTPRPQESQRVSSSSLPLSSFSNPCPQRRYRTPTEGGIRTPTEGGMQTPTEGGMQTPQPQEPRRVSFTTLRLNPFSRPLPQHRYATEDDIQRICQSFHDLTRDIFQDLVSELRQMNSRRGGSRNYEADSEAEDNTQGNRPVRRRRRRPGVSCRTDAEKAVSVVSSPAVFRFVLTLFSETRKSSHGDLDPQGQLASRSHPPNGIPSLEPRQWAMLHPDYFQTQLQRYSARRLEHIC